MTDFSVGPGVQQAMADAGDEARSDEQFIVLREGNKISQTFGRDATYFWIEADNRTNRVPFEGEVPADGVAWDPWAEQPAQLYDWTCSAAATEWTERSVGAGRGSDIYANREQVVYAIGYPSNISPALGLHDGSGVELQRVLHEQAALHMQQGWLSFDQAYNIYSHVVGLGSGAAYYHWVAFRGAGNGRLYIANSAPGYRGIWNELTRADWDNLGSWSCLWSTS